MSDQVFNENGVLKNGCYYCNIDKDIELSNKVTPNMIQPQGVMDKLQEISGELQVISAKLDGRKID